VEERDVSDTEGLQSIIHHAIVVGRRVAYGVHVIFDTDGMAWWRATVNGVTQDHRMQEEAENWVEEQRIKAAAFQVMMALDREGWCIERDWKPIDTVPAEGHFLFLSDQGDVDYGSIFDGRPTPELMTRWGKAVMWRELPGL
jgi:hypothetical protein